MPQKRQCDYREAGAARQENIQAVWQPVPDGLKFYDQFRDPSRSTVFPPCAIIQPHAALFVNRNKKHSAGYTPAALSKAHDSGRKMEGRGKPAKRVQPLLIKKVRTEPVERVTKQRQCVRPPLCRPLRGL